MTTNRMDTQKEMAPQAPTESGTCPVTGQREAPVVSSVVLDRESPEFLSTAYATYAELRAT
jgi:hypothetical protein